MLYGERAEFYDRITKAITPQAENTRPSHPLEAYVGTYTGKLYGDATVSVEDDHLVLRLLPNKDLVADLAHLHYDTFVIHWRNEFAWFSEGTSIETSRAIIATTTSNSIRVKPHEA